MQGPFYIWSTETDEEREEALHQIAILNGEIDVREKALNAAWKTTAEWRELREHELQAGREIFQRERRGILMPGGTSSMLRDPSCGLPVRNGWP